MNILLRVSEQRLLIWDLVPESAGLVCVAGLTESSRWNHLFQQQTPSLALALQAEVFKDQSVRRQAVEQSSDMLSSRQETSQTGVKCKDWPY